MKEFIREHGFTIIVFAIILIIVLTTVFGEQISDAFTNLFNGFIEAATPTFPEHETFTITIQ